VLDETVTAALSPAPAGLGMLDVIDLSIDAMQSLVTRYRLAAYPPDLLISVPRAACRTLDFHKANEMIDLGRQLAAEALERDQAFSRAHTDDGSPG
jgi:NTE family protein